MKVSLFGLLCSLIFSIGATAQTLNDDGSVITIGRDRCCDGEDNELYDGEDQTFAIPETISFNSINFKLRGGDGGSAKAGDCKRFGGDGAAVTITAKVGSGTNEINPGGKIRFIVGKHGGKGSVGGTSGVGGGGGGGSAVLYQRASGGDWIILAVAGGGGGAYQGNFLGACIESESGQGGRASENGGNGAGNYNGSGGKNGNGGGKGDHGQYNDSGGGGGAYSNGADTYIGGKKGYPKGGRGENTTKSGGWGFGGGGSGGTLAPGGGGGGYSGGGGGGGGDNGGGGGSYLNPDFSYLGEKADGGKDTETEHGRISYEFKNSCMGQIDSIEEITGFCSSLSSVAQIQVHASVSGPCQNIIYQLWNSSGPVGTNNSGLFSITQPDIYAVWLRGVIDGDPILLDTEVLEITNEDLYPPTAKCKNASVSLQNESQLFVDFEDYIDDGSYDNCAIASRTASRNSFSCSDIGPVAVTLTVTDQAGMSSSCTATVTVKDEKAPIPDISDLPIIRGSCFATVSSAPTATDNCDGTITATTTDPLTYTEQGAYFITWTYQDSKGNTQNQNQIVMVNDQETPTVACPADITVDLSSGSCSAIVDYYGMASDNCESTFGSVTYTGNSAKVPAGADRLLLVQVCHFGDVTAATYNDIPMTLAVRQDARIAGTCEIWMLPLGSGEEIDATAEVSGVGSPKSINYVTFANVDQDAPLGDMDQGKNQDALTVSTRPRDMIYEGFMRKDGNAISPRSGQTEIFDWSFNISGSRCWGAYLAGIGGPQPLKVSTNNGAHVAIVIKARYRTQLSYSIAPGSSFPAGTTQVSFTATDESNLSSSCTFDVTVNEATPTITCPDDIIVDTDPGLCTAAVIFDVSGADECGSIILEQTSGQPSGSDFPLGTTQNTFEVVNASGSSSSCSFKITVNDNQNPMAICQDHTVQLDPFGSGSVTPADIDNGSFDACGSLSFSLSTGGDLQQVDYSCADLNTVSYMILEVTDDSDNSSTCFSLVTIVDQVAPEIACTDVTISLNENGVGAIYEELVGSQATDNCSQLSVTGDGYVSFDCNDVGETFPYTFSATDKSGNTTSCTLNVQVVDELAPVIACTDMTVSLNENGAGTFSEELVADQVTDNCGGSSIIGDGYVAFDCNDVGETFPYTFSATDKSGNTTACTINVQVVDELAPVIACTDMTVSLNENGAGAFYEELVADQVTDNCGGSFITGDGYVAFDCNDVGETFPYTFTATDESGNTTTCTIDIAVTDQMAPTAQCKDLEVSLDANSLASVTPADIDNGSFDNCGSVSFSLSTESDLQQVDFSCADVGNFPSVLLEVTDQSGNSSTCFSEVTVVDNTAPTLSCKSFDWLTLDETGNATLDPQSLFTNSSDNCGITLFNLSQSEFSCEDLGIVEVSLTAQDQAGNISNTCSAEIAVFPNTPSFEFLQIDLVALDENGQAILNIDEVAQLTAGVCNDVLKLTFQDGGIAQAFTCQDIGEQYVEIVVTGQNGEEYAQGSIAITVVETISPTALCKDVEVSLDANGQGAVTTADIDNGSMDNCGITSLSLDYQDFSCTHVGDLNTVTLIATDASGNSSTCTANVIVTDDIAPTLTCPEDMVANTDAGECGAYVSLPKAAPFDNCSIKNLESRYRATDEEGTAIGAWSDWDGDQSGFFGQGFYEIQWRAKDESGNQGFCSFTLEVKDEEAPEVVCQDITISFNGEENITIPSTSIFDPTTSFDACGEVSFVSQSLTEVSCEDVGEILVVEVLGADPHGNTSTCTSLVTVEGILCDFEATGIDCLDGASAEYDPTDASFTLTSEACPGYPQGAFSWLGTRLCGDGEIIAEVTDLTGDGRVGVVMMESQEQGARLVSIVKDFTPRVRTEYRSTTGGSLSHKSKNRTGVDWLRIVRTGNKFKTYTSTNGSYWRLAHTINFSNFEDCIYVGLMLYNKNGGEPVTATFENVKITGENGDALKLQPNIPASTTTEAGGQSMEQGVQPDLQLAAFPNPFSDQLTIRYATTKAGQVDLAVFNLQGQLVRMLYQGQADVGEQQLQQWDGTDTSGNPLPAGMYLIQMKTGEEVVNQKVLLQAN